MPRPRSTLVTRESAAHAAIEIIDARGLSNFNLASVAQRLAVSTPSLYNHFRDKDDLLKEVSRTILLKTEMPSRRPPNWRDLSVMIALNVRRSILRHPNAAPLLLMYPPRHIIMQIYEGSARMYEKLGIPPDLHLTIIGGMESIILGSSLLAASLRAQSLTPFLVYDPHEFPCLAAAGKLNKRTEEEIFEKALRTYLDGIWPPTESETQALSESDPKHLSLAD